MDPDAIFEALLEPAGREDPYPLYAALHQHGAVLPAGAGLILVPGYAAVSSVLRDPEFGVDDAEVFDRGFPQWREHPALDAQTLLSLNGADHKRIRGLIARQFTQRRIRALEPALSALTDRLLDAIADQGSDGSPVDFMQEFAYALPIAVICDLIGVPDWDVAVLRPLARRMLAILEPEIDDDVLAEGDAAAVELADMFAAVVADRRRRPREDLVSRLVEIADSGDGRLSQAELVQNLILLLTAGFECSAGMLGNGMRILLTHPGAGADLKSGTVTPAAFVEEVLRYDGPVQDTGRRRRTSGELCGVPVDSDDEVVLLLGAANRDPRRFAEPDSFRPGRTDGGSLSFGAGAHFCLGAVLARLQGTIVFPRLLRRFPAVAAAAEPERRASTTFRAFERMDITV
ncbi:MAG TPA: cytochrome P450 [Streptosporangiaceae bacterium]|nr:cytochrome P450 [Streptosporangiaceae bacterium]